MTKEIIDIIAAFKDAQKQGRQTALATVVHVEGSSYRRPGARMLVEDNGKITGAISGGCLEGDALRKALLAMSQHQNKLVTYNTQDPDDVEFGVQLGCNGIVHILFEPIDPSQTNNPMALLEKLMLHRKDAVLVTLFSLKNHYGHQPGTCFFLNDETSYVHEDAHKLAPQIQEDALTVLDSGSSVMKPYPNSEFSAFLEFQPPTVSLVIVGAGNDAIPMMEIATILGWQVAVIDGRTTHANKFRFPTAHHIIIGKPADAIKELMIDERTVFVLMTHNYNYDLAMLELLLKRDCRYIGTLGPKNRLQRMFSELQDQDVPITDRQRHLIYGPTGLDIGAEAPEEIALSIIAEIKAVLAQRPGTFLRDKLAGIHSRSVFSDR